MDAKNLQLIRLLENNARQSSETLAAQIGMSSAAVRRRIAKLLDSGVLRIVGRVDPERVGFPYTAIIALDVVQGNIRSTSELLAQQQEIIWLSTTTGRYDILCIARFQSPEDLSGFIENRLTEIEGIRNSETFVCLRKKKGGYGLI